MTCKLEAKLTVAASSYGCHVDSGSAAYIAAADYYLESIGSGVASLRAAFQALLAAAVGGTTVTVADATGIVTVTWGSGSHALNWDGTLLRDALGFAGNVASAATAVGTKQAKPLWLPNCDPAELEGATGSLGSYEIVGSETRSLDGEVCQRVHGELVNQRLAFGGLTRAKTWTAHATRTNEAAESFWRSYRTATWRYYTDRTDDTTYVTLDGRNRDYRPKLAQGFRPQRVERKSDAVWSWGVDLYLDA